MPPKVKATPAKATAPKEKTLAEPVTETADQAEWKQLKNEADTLHKLTKKEEIEFNIFQQQREKLNYFWMIEKKRQEDKKAEIRNKEREIQDLEEQYNNEIKNYKIKLKHLIYENQNNISRHKIGLQYLQRLELDTYLTTTNTLKSENHTITKDNNNININNDEYIRIIKKEHDKSITELRHQFEKEANTIQSNYEQKLIKIRENLDKKRRLEIKEIEENKELLVNNLIITHQNEFNEIKGYYNDITHNNLDMIKSLKEEVNNLGMRYMCVYMSLCVCIYMF